MTSVESEKLTWAYEQGGRKAEIHDKKNFWTAHLRFQAIPVFTEKISRRKHKYKERYSALYFACNCACDN